jgi:hypothetical protein
MGGGPFCYFPMAEKFQRRGIRNVFTISSHQSSHEPVPVLPLIDKINQVAKLCFDSGAEKIEFALIGHSLGAIEASKYIWLHEPNTSHVRVSMMISVAGRLKYIPNKFNWFCQDVKPDINKTYKQIQKHPSKVLFYSVPGEKECIS